MLHAYWLLPLSIKVFYAGLLLASLINLLGIFMPRIQGHWRFAFGYTGTLLAIYCLYIALRLSNVLDSHDYQTLVGWLFPLLAFAYVIPVFYLRWQSKFYKQAVERQADELRSSLDR